MTSMRERLLSKTQTRYRAVKLPDGDVVTIRSLSERERTMHELRNVNRKTGETDYSRLPESKLHFIAACLVDGETKEQLLQPEDWEQLRNVDSAVTSCIYSACLSHNGFEASEVEELVGNSN